MISSVEELDAARRIIDHTIASLHSRGVVINASIPIGVMIETPAAALLARSLAERVQFLSIGTNDLAQYTLATDRTNELVADIFDAMHPAVVRLIAQTVDAANEVGIPVSVCGELAGHAAATELLLGLGLRELSVAPSLALELKHRIRMADSVACADAVATVLTCTSTTEVYAVLQLLQAGDHGRMIT
jgi:phosphotransferase system enzyme I (PtsI)